MSGTDEYERWMNGSRERDYEALFDEVLGELGLPAPIGVAPMDTVREAIEVMNAHTVGCVLIGVDRHVAGIFTERDAIRKVALAGSDVLHRPVSEFMTHDPLCLQATDRVVHAIAAMVEGGFRHVPILDSEGRARGVFGMRAFVSYIADMHPQQLINAPPPGQEYAKVPEGA